MYRLVIGRVNKPLKVHGHEFKISAFSMVVYIFLATLSGTSATCVRLGSYENQMPRQD